MLALTHYGHKCFDGLMGIGTGTVFRQFLPREGTKKIKVRILKLNVSFPEFTLIVLVTLFQK